MISDNSKKGELGPQIEALDAQGMRFGVNRPMQLVDAQRALKQIGVYLVAAFSARFRNQGTASEKWLPRAVPNVAGVIKDIAEGGRIKPHRYDPRPAGIDTARLSRSISHRVDAQAGYVEAGSNVPYASAVQEGGEHSIQVPVSVRDWIVKKLLNKRTKNDPKYQMLRRIISRKSGVYRLKVPPRPFVYLDTDDKKRINEIVAKAIGQAPGV